MKNTSVLPSKADLDLRYAQLLAGTQDLPPEGSLPMTVCGRVVGWVSPAAVACLTELSARQKTMTEQRNHNPSVYGCRPIHVTAEAVHIAWGGAPNEFLNEVLAEIAQCLQAAGLIKAWRNELLDVIADGQAVAAIERGAVRPLGLLTQAVHLNAWSADGKLWVAKRAANKSTDPNRWDSLVGGLASAFESLDLSLLRESEEEAGLSAAQLHRLEPMRSLMRMHRRLPEGYQVEHVLVNDCVLDEGVIPENQDGEVSEIRLVSIADWWEMTQSGVFTLEAELVLIDSVRLRLMQA